MEFPENQWNPWKSIHGDSSVEKQSKTHGESIQNRVEKIFRTYIENQWTSKETHVIN